MSDHHDEALPYSPLAIKAWTALSAVFAVIIFFAFCINGPLTDFFHCGVESRSLDLQPDHLIQPARDTCCLGSPSHSVRRTLPGTFSLAPVARSATATQTCRAKVRA